MPIQGAPQQITKPVEPNIPATVSKNAEKGHVTVRLIDRPDLGYVIAPSSFRLTEDVNRLFKEGLLEFTDVQESDAILDLDPSTRFEVVLSNTSIRDYPKLRTYFRIFKKTKLALPNYANRSRYQVGYYLVEDPYYSLYNSYIQGGWENTSIDTIIKELILKSNIKVGNIVTPKVPLNEFSFVTPISWTVGKCIKFLLTKAERNCKCYTSRELNTKKADAYESFICLKSQTDLIKQPPVKDETTGKEEAIYSEFEAGVTVNKILDVTPTDFDIGMNKDIEYNKELFSIEYESKLASRISSVRFSLADAKSEWFLNSVKYPFINKIIENTYKRNNQKSEFSTGDSEQLRIQLENEFFENLLNQHNLIITVPGAATHQIGKAIKIVLPSKFITTSVRNKYVQANYFVRRIEHMYFRNGIYRCNLYCSTNSFEG